MSQEEATTTAVHGCGGNGTMTTVVGGKHAALWERMRSSQMGSKRRPQMIHRRFNNNAAQHQHQHRQQTQVHQPSPKPKDSIIGNSKSSGDVPPPPPTPPSDATTAVPTSISMTSSPLVQDDDDEDESQLVGIQIDHQDSSITIASTAATVNNTHQNQQTKQQQKVIYALETSFVSASSSSSSASTWSSSSIPQHDDDDDDDNIILLGTACVTTPLSKTAAASSSSTATSTTTTPHHHTTPNVIWNEWRQQQQQTVQDDSIFYDDNDSSNDDDDDEPLVLLEHSRMVIEEQEKEEEEEDDPSASSSSNNNNDNVYLLKRRIHELEQALRVANESNNNNNNTTTTTTNAAATTPTSHSSTTTPTGTNSSTTTTPLHGVDTTVVVDSSPSTIGTTTTTAKGGDVGNVAAAVVPSPLLERNKTLVKEVKFAEQTCVELSQRNVDLEQHVRQLQQTLQSTQVQLQDAQTNLKWLQSNRNCPTLQAGKDSWQQQQQTQTTHHDRQHTQLKLGKENCAPNAVSNRTTITSNEDRDCYDDGNNNDKLVQLERQLMESQRALQETKQQLEQSKRLKQQQQQHGNDKTTTTTTSSSSTTSNNNNHKDKDMSSELELAHAQAKLASVSKDLQLVRVAESSARHALSRANEQIKELQRQQQVQQQQRQHQEEAIIRRNNNDGEPQQHEHEQERVVVQLQATVEALRRECHEHKSAAFQASDTIRSLEGQLEQARNDVVLERERWQHRVVELTQAALGTVERQSLALDQKVRERTKDFMVKIESLSFAVRHLQDSLDFQSDTSSGSVRDDDSDEETERLVGEHSTEEEAAAQKGDDQDGSHITVLNATFHQSQSDGRSFHEEMLLEQMEEARRSHDRDDESAGHGVIDDLSLIADMSHLYEDLSALLMQDPTSPERSTSADAVLKLTSSAVKSKGGNVSSTEKSSVQGSLECVEQDFLQLRAILDRARNASSQGNHGLVGTVEEQTNVIRRMERKLGDLADEAGKCDAERRQLNAAVLELSKAFERCQSELEDKSKKLQASQEAEAEAKSEIQQTLQGLHKELQEKQSSIAELQNDKERLSATVRHLTTSSEELLRNREEIESDQVKKLQGKLESVETQLAMENLRCDKLSQEVERRKCSLNQQEMTICDLEQSNAALATAKSEIAEQYEEASLMLRTLSNECEQQKKEVLKAKRREKEVRSEATIGAETITVQKEELAKVKTERDNALAKSAKLSKMANELTEERSELLRNVEQLKGELDYLKVSYITCNDKLADLSERNANKDEIVEKFRSSNRAAKEAIASYEDRVSLLTTEVEKSESDREALKMQLDAIQKVLEATTDDFANYKDAMEEKLSERNDLIEVVQSTGEALKNTYQHKLATLTAEHKALEVEINKVVTSFVNEFRSAFVDSMKSLSQIGCSFNDGDMQSPFESNNFVTWSESLKVASQKLPQWKQVVAECCQAVVEYQGRLDHAEGKIETLVSKAQQIKDAESRMEEKLREQQVYSEKLAKDLFRAESEATKSAKEVSEMTETFAATKRELAHVSQLLADQRNLKETTQELIAEREDAESRAIEMNKTLQLLEEKLTRAASELTKLRKQVQDTDELNLQLESRNASLNLKCERLRDFIRKLTDKCEEWASYAEKQTEVIRRVKNRQHQIATAAKEKRQVDSKRQSMQTSSSAHEMETTTTTTIPPSLSRTQAGQKENDQWSVERRMLHRVTNLVEKDDLDELASELRNFGLN